MIESLSTSLGARPARAGRERLARLATSITTGDPAGLVPLRSRLLCATLGDLATACYAGLGGTSRAREVGDAAALLSLLTKIDDQVIDSPAFHGGLSPAAAAARTRAFLAPTLASIQRARPANGEGRCLLAADLGERLRRLSAPSRLEAFLAMVARGWAVQTEAVATLSRHPAETDPDHILDLTARVGGYWLGGVSLVGALPPEARPLAPQTFAGFLGWGLKIQSADALADLEKDLRERLLSSLPLSRLHAADPSGCTRALRSDDRVWIYAQLRGWGIDQALLSVPAGVPAPPGGLPDLLGRIHLHLAGRYRAHPLAHPLTHPRGMEARCSVR